ncbi:hypothetical protein GCM10011320_54850 [Neoroseomonas lacus]|uniref:Uncharacterized protein n=1 Tax=Neoroseomonas lacus TaxID=287609 RepID=A0A917L1B0_9PROT|nr:hypothetical protein GCM10011320_54850 [Neoroseomonas lacus]
MEAQFHPEAAETFHHPPMPDDPQAWWRQEGLDEDPHRTPAGHADAEHLVIQVKSDQPWLTIGQAVQRGVSNGAFGTSAADPAGDDGARRVDQRLVASMGGGGAHRLDHDGEGVRFSAAGKGRHAFNQCGSVTHSGPRP